MHMRDPRPKYPRPLSRRRKQKLPITLRVDVSQALRIYIGVCLPLNNSYSPIDHGHLGGQFATSVSSDSPASLTCSYHEFRQSVKSRYVQNVEILSQKEILFGISERSPEPDELCYKGIASSVKKAATIQAGQRNEAYAPLRNWGQCS